MWSFWAAVLFISFYTSNGLEENYRLPVTISPVAYTLTVQPYLLDSDPIRKRFTFDGEVVIEITPTSSTKEIYMHSLNITYIEREFWTGKDPTKKTKLEAGKLNEITNIIVYNAPQQLEVSQTYFLRFKYTGKLSDDMLGFYRSTYVDTKGIGKFLASTQFQTMHARRAFPCFDEPSFKATFQVNIIRPNSLNSFSNTRISSTTDFDANWKKDTYIRTPKMSTYLLAFIISEFQLRGSDTFGVISRPEYYAQTQFSYESGQKSLTQLETYFNIPYYSMGVDKMHMAAIPDFDAGAMENWGLLTYRERALLYDPESTSLSAKQYIAQVVTHEQTHMWFGDLVTCDWWSHTWLNEAFARYFQYFATHAVEPKWEQDKQFVTAQLQVIMGMDATFSTNPLSDEDTNTPADLSRMFNSITYNKGGTFVRSINHILGESNFQKALREYLKANEYKNTKPQNLFDYFIKYWPQAHKIYANNYLHRFTEQVGFPVVNLKLSDDGTNFTISQKRFLLPQSEGSDASLIYTVPISFTTDLENNFNNTSPRLFLDTSGVQTIKLKEKVNWVIANLQEAYYYRVNYDTKTWHAIHKVLKSGVPYGGIHELNRAQICNDLLNLARTNEIGYDLAFDILDYLSEETNYLPWSAAFDGLSYLQIRLGTDENNFSKYIRTITEKSYNSIGFDEKSTDEALLIYLRSALISWSCKSQNEHCIKKSLDLFRASTKTPVPVNIRSAVYCNSMRYGNESDFNLLYDKYRTTKSPTENNLILSNLGCVKDEKLVNRWFNIILTDAVRLQDKSTALSGLYTSNNENVWSVFKLATDNYEKLAKETSVNTASSTIANIAARFTEQSQLDALKEFNQKTKNFFPGVSGTRLTTAEKTVASNLAWDDKNLPVLREYLLKKTNGSSVLQSFSWITLLLMPLIARYLY